MKVDPFQCQYYDCGPNSKIAAIRPHFIFQEAVKAWIIANFANFYMNIVSKIFSQIFFVKFWSRIFLNFVFCIVTQIGASFDHFPYFSDFVEYRISFILVSYEIKHVSHGGRNFCHLELLLAHCVGRAGSESLYCHPGAHLASLDFPDFQQS